MFQGRIESVKSAIDDHIEAFGDGIDLMMVKDSITEDELIDAIEEAVENDKEVPISSFIYFKEPKGEVI